jgi:hypothetical protein
MEASDVKLLKSKELLWSMMTTYCTETSKSGRV